MINHINDEIITMAKKQRSLRNANWYMFIPELVEAWVTFETDFPMPEPDPPDCTMPSIEVRFRSNRSEMTENGSRQTRPSSKRNAKCDGPTSICDTSTFGDPKEPPAWLPDPEPKAAETEGIEGSPKFPLRSLSPTSRSFSPSCSADPGRGCTTNCSGMFTIFGMMADDYTANKSEETEKGYFSLILRSSKSKHMNKKFVLKFWFAITNSLL